MANTKKKKKVETLSSYKAKVRKFQKANMEMVNFMHEHLLDLTDEVLEEYEALCDKKDEAEGEL